MLPDLQTDSGPSSNDYDSGLDSRTCTLPLASSHQTYPCAEDENQNDVSPLNSNPPQPPRQELSRQPAQPSTDCPAKQSRSILATCVLDRVNATHPDTRLLLHEELSENCQDLTSEQLHTFSSKIQTESNNETNTNLRDMENAMDGLDTPMLLSDDVTQKIAEIGTEKCSWCVVLLYTLLYINVYERVQQDEASRDLLLKLFDNIERVFKGNLANWIKKQGGWVNYQHVDMQKDIAAIIDRIRDLFLAEQGSFVVIVHDTPSPYAKLSQDIAVCFNRCYRTPRVFVCGNKPSQCVSEELGHFSQFPNAVFVAFVTRNSVNKLNMISCYEKFLKNPPRHVVIPIEINGLKQRDFPECLRKFKSIKALSKTSWKDSEVQEFVGKLKDHIDTTFENDLIQDLKVNVDDLIQIEITTTIPAKHLSDVDRFACISVIKTQMQNLLEDPWTPLRQHLLHMYRVKNIRVDNVQGSARLVVEISTLEHPVIDKLFSNYSNGILRSIFKDHVKVPEIKERFEYTLSIDEQKSNNIKNRLQERDRLGQMTSDDKQAHIRGSVIKEMIEKKSVHDWHDIYKEMPPNTQVKHVTESGRNILHMIVTYSRPDCFKVVFYTNNWDTLRLQMIDPELDSQYGGYTPRGLAEKFLFKSNGPNTLEEYDHFDRLWIQMSDLHKACLSGNFNYVKALVDRGHDINSKDIADAPCVLYACAVGSTKIVNFLIERGANPKEKNNKGEDGLILAAMFGRSAVVRVLLSRFDFTKDNRDINKCRAIDYVAMHGDVETLDVFTDCGTFLDDRLVSLAAKYKRSAMVKKLVVEHELNVRGTDDDGRTPFLNAASTGETNTLTFLLENEYDGQPDDPDHRPSSIIMDRDKYNNNVLHIVAEFDHFKCCEFLVKECIKRGCLSQLLNDRNFYTGKERLITVRGRDRGRKAWHHLSINRSLMSYFKKKMSTGQIDVKLFGDIKMSGFGQNPNKQQLQETNDMLESTLKEKRLDMTPLLLATFKDHREIAEFLLDQKASPDIPDHFSNTAMHYSGMRGNMELAKKLEQQQANIGAQNVENKTPADVAEDNHHMAFVNLVRGKQIYKHAAGVSNSLRTVKDQLHTDKLQKLRSEGQDIRRHLIATLRDMKIQLNKALQDLGSGPVLEESSASTTFHNSGSSGAGSNSAFAGLRPEYAPYPALISAANG